jgi:hypothetical protein
MTTPARRALRDLTTALLAHTDTHIPRDEASRSVSTATLAVQIVDHQRCEFANLASGIIAELPDPESGRARLWQKDGGWWCPITEEAYQHAVDACDSLACGRCASCVAEDAADQEAVQGLRRLTFTLDQVVGQLRQLADDAKTVRSALVERQLAEATSLDPTADAVDGALFLLHNVGPGLLDLVDLVKANRSDLNGARA